MSAEIGLSEYIVFDEVEPIRIYFPTEISLSRHENGVELLIRGNGIHGSASIILTNEQFRSLISGGEGGEG